MYDVWKNVLETIRDKTNEQNFNLWFKPIKVSEPEPDKWLLQVPTRFFRDWISDHYGDILERAFYEVLQKPVSLSIEVLPSSQKPKDSSYIVKRSKPVRRKHNHGTCLGLTFNPKFTFDSFVVGSSNEFAHAACKAVSKQPGKSYNPLFIYGETGVGKTHLLQAIGATLLKSNKNLKINYTTSERFMNELINSIKTNKMIDFKRRYRDQSDILLIDDIQFIAGKTSTQEEFFHTFNDLFESGKQIVVTSDKYPMEMKTLEERIRSRLQSGLVADIKPPDIETRTAILESKSEQDGFNLDPEVLAFLAKHIKSNVRELEGALIRLEAFSSLTGTTITLAVAKEVLKNFLHNLPSNISVEQIQKNVCQYFKIKRGEMISKSRKRVFLIPRQIAIYLVKHYTDLSLNEIGSRFGGKDHTTILASLNRLEKLMLDDMNIRNTVESLEKQINS